MSKPKNLFELFFTFFKIGLFTFGGGYAMIGVIENIFVERKKWLTNDQMANIAVIAESTPGPIAINSATYIGNSLYGFMGAVCATLGVVLPSFIIIFIISLGFEHIISYRIVANAFKGVKIGVSLIILDAGINMAMKTEKSAFTKAIIIASCATVVCINAFSLKISSIVLMLVAGSVSLSMYFLKEYRRNEK